MAHSTIPLPKTGAFSGLFLDYIEGKESLTSFYTAKPTLESFAAQIVAKQKSYQHRDLLIRCLQHQNEGSRTTDLQQDNLRKLGRSNTFTITTGHQLSLATGPLYFIYKILTVIRLCEELKTAHAEMDFVPTFWMATEDHDLLEINHFFLFGKKHEWQINAKGAAGKVSTEGLESFFKEIKDLPEWLKEAYVTSSNLAEATRKIVHHLFGEYGVLVIDGDDASLKSVLKPIVANDLLQGKYAPLIKETSAQLEAQGYKAQAFVRDQNFFFLQNGLRERIEKQENGFQVLNTGYRFSEEELTEAIQNNPQSFSPNVLMRPLYQEIILPNLAYIGGPGELAYWLQLKSTFETEEIPFPILFPRNFATILSANLQERITAAGLKIEDFFLSDDKLKALLLEKLQVEKFDFTREESLLKELKERLQTKASKADKSLMQAVEAEMAKTAKSIIEIEKRLNKAMENKHETDLNRLHTIRKKFFPDGELQERHENLLNFYINQPAFVELVYKELRPFDFQMHVITV